MTNSTYNPWLHRFAVLTALATLALLCVGGLVTSHGVGMSVPDWPTTYGYNMFFFPISQWTGGIFYEHTHRLVASAVGLLTAILAGWIWTRETTGVQRWLGLVAIFCTLGLMGVRTQGMFIALACVALVVMVYSLARVTGDARPLRWWAAAAFSAVLVQGVLGGLRVTALKDEIGIFHGALAQLFFALICAIALFTSKWWIESRPEDENCADDASRSLNLRYLFVATTTLIFLQLILGATMRHQHAGLAIPDFPLAYGKVWPDTSEAAVAVYNARRIEVTAANPITASQIVLQMAHRVMAVVILVCVGFVAWRARKSSLNRLALLWLGLIFVQAGLGAWTIWSNKAADVATAHVLVGALSLVTGVLGCIICFRRLGVTDAATATVESSEESRSSTFAAGPTTVSNQ